MSKIEKDQEQQLDNEKFALAMQAIEISRNAVLVNLRFMDTAFSLLKVRPSSHLNFATDGQTLHVNPDYVLKTYAEESNQIARDYLHAVLHCVFHHPFFDEAVVSDLWDLACDIAVEATINDLDVAVTHTSRAELQRAYITRLKSEVGLLSAEKLYAYFRDSEMTSEQAEKQREIFYADDHQLWYDFSVPEKKKQDEGSDGKSGTQRATEQGKESRAGTEGDTKPKDPGYREKSEQAMKPTAKKKEPENIREARGPRYANSVALDRSRDQWKNAAYQMGVELESFATMWGSEGSGLTMQLKAVNREKQDYSEFLRRFADHHEEIKVNDEEFDYIYYCYGLNLYENVPLIEPLEYVDEKRVRDFVIAIDTSASTKDDLVHKFITKTYNILHETESFSTKMNLFIIQCDAEIQEVARIRSRRDFDRYLETMEIKGLGGTDFRPVFEYVDQLIDQHEFENLGGLIYFTDGQGSYPAKKPDYDVAFVFVDDDFGEDLVPSWAMKVLLESEDIAKFDEF